MYDLIIKNGHIINGLGEAEYKSDIGIVDDTIVTIGNLAEDCAKLEIDATNLVVTPGFIDTHSHSDLVLLEDPWLEPKVRQGITTEVLGQDGVSVAPLATDCKEAWKKHLAGLLGEINRDWDWKTISDYIGIVKKRGTATNLAYLVPHGNLRMVTMGLENRKPLSHELALMKSILRQSLEQGAFGLSTGLIYAPCVFGDATELVELCKVVAEYDGVFVIHQRSEGDDILNSMDEVIHISRQSGVRVHFSHFKIAGKKNWSLINDVIEKITVARREGLEITLDQYPYTAGSTMLSVILPPWVHDGGTECLLERLRDHTQRAKIKRDIKNGIKGWDNFIEWAGTDGIYITAVKTQENQRLVGKNLLEIANVRGYDDPLEATFDLLIEENNAVGMIDFVMDETTIRIIMQDNQQMFCTDGLLGGTPHPRVYGTFPRVISNYVRQQHIISLPEAIKKMTFVPAKMLGLKDRGILKDRYKADLVIFDFNQIQDTSTYENPRRYPQGIHYVIINGKVVLEKGQRAKLLSGNFLSK